MSDVRLDEALWDSRMLPEGTVERWLVDDGRGVAAGERLVEVRIEDALHEVVAPAAGRLSILAPANSVVEPGSILARVA